MPSMTISEYRTALDALDERGFANYRSDFGGDFSTRQQYVDDFVHHPDHERRICQSLRLTTEEEKLTKATLISAEAAAQSARSARWSMIWAALSVLIALAALWAMVRLSGGTTVSQQSLKDAAAQIGRSPSQAGVDSLGWTIESYEQGVITVTHQGSTYKATCNVSRSFNNAPAVTDSKNVVEFPTCDLPVDLVGHVVQPFLGQQRDATGRIVSMWNVGSILAIQQSRNDNTPFRIDEFIITSVAKSH
jgi:hypothetical protein